MRRTRIGDARPAPAGPPSRAAVFVPDGVHPAATQAIRDEGAEVTHVPGDYDTAVRAAEAAVRAAAPTAPGAILVQDMAWDGYEDVPQWIVDGYHTLFAEIDDAGVTAPGLVVVPAGVGSLLQAALTHYRGATGPRGGVGSHGGVEPRSGAKSRGGVGSHGGAESHDGAGTRGGAGRTSVVSVEPEAADCVRASVATGHPVTVNTGRTGMAGLNRGTV